MLRIKGLERQIPGLRIRVRELEIARGEVFVLLGPTGAGKSRFLEVLAGFARPQEGELWLDNREITGLPPEQRQISVLFQQPFLFPNLDVAGNIRYGSRDNDLFQFLIEAFSLGPHLQKRVDVVSGGERQLVALARALMVRPLVLLLDEAFSAVDPEQRRQIIQAFQKVQSELGITSLAVTHNFEEALYLGSRIGIMMEGQLVQTGEPDAVFLQPASAGVARFLGADNLFHGEFVPAVTGQSDTILPAVFRSGQVQLQVIADRTGPGYVLIHQQDITVSVEEPSPSSALNHLHGRISHISRLGAVCRLRVEAGLSFRVTITPRSLENLHLKEGSKVHLSFKAAAIRTFCS